MKIALLHSRLQLKLNSRCRSGIWDPWRRPTCRPVSSLLPELSSEGGLRVEETGLELDSQQV